MRFVQACDLVEPPPAPAGLIDVSRFPGDWVNSNPATSGIARLKMSDANGKLLLQVFAIGPDALVDWGTARVNVFAASPSSRVGAGFTCVFDFGFAETRLQGMIMKGLLVLAQFHRFKDDSRRASYFVREYFALDHELF